MSLARLWKHQGKREEARESLVPIYGCFTERCNTADLREGKVLLAELASASLEAMLKPNAMPALCPQRPAAPGAAGGGDIEAGPTPDHDPPRSDPGRGH
jgi:hypothetical protein